MAPVGGLTSTPIDPEVQSIAHCEAPVTLCSARTAGDPRALGDRHDHGESFDAGPVRRSRQSLHRAIHDRCCGRGGRRRGGLDQSHQHRGVRVEVLQVLRGHVALWDVDSEALAGEAE